MAEMIDALNNLVRTHNQFKDDSELWRDIQAVTECSDKQAKKWAGEHCNMVSFWMMINARKILEIDYPTYFQACLDEGFCREDGYINKTKDIILAHWGIEYKRAYFETWDNVKDPSDLSEDKLYQFKIKGHYMSSYIQDGQVMISDTSSRGIGVPALKVIKQKQFIWMLEV